MFITTIYDKLETTKAIAAFLLGDITTAKKDVVRAWMVAKIADPAARIRYPTCMAPARGATQMQGGENGAGFSRRSKAGRSKMRIGISANRVQLQQALMNLMLNGIEAMTNEPANLLSG